MIKGWTHPLPYVIKIFEKAVSMSNCGNKNPQVRCRQMQCEDCEKLREGKAMLNPVPIPPPIEKFTVKEFKLWFKGFEDVINAYNFPEAILKILKEKIENLKE